MNVTAQVMGIQYAFIVKDSTGSNIVIQITGSNYDDAKSKLIAAFTNDVNAAVPPPPLA